MMICDACMSERVVSFGVTPHNTYFGTNQCQWQRWTCEQCLKTKECVSRPDQVPMVFGTHLLAETKEKFDNNLRIYGTASAIVCPKCGEIINAKEGAI